MERKFLRFDIENHLGSNDCNYFQMKYLVMQSGLELFPLYFYFHCCFNYLLNIPNCAGYCCSLD